MVQILGGLITYLLIAIYCREQFNENVSIKRVRELRTSILNELFSGQRGNTPASDKGSIAKKRKRRKQAKA